MLGESEIFLISHPLNILSANKLLQIDSRSKKIWWLRHLYRTTCRKLGVKVFSKHMDFPEWDKTEQMFLSRSFFLFCSLPHTFTHLLAWTCRLSKNDVMAMHAPLLHACIYGSFYVCKEKEQSPERAVLQLRNVNHFLRLNESLHIH